MVTYRTDGPWGIGKGGNLLPVEIDRNFHSLDLKIAAKEETTVAADIEVISVAGSQIRMKLKDGRRLGPFSIPLPTLTFRGDFADAEDYLANDIVQTPTATYLVLIAHTGVDPFDEDREIAAAPVYQKIFEGERDVFPDVVDLVASTETAVLGLGSRYIRLSGVTSVTIPPFSAEAFPIGTLLTFRCAASPATEFLGGTSGFDTVELLVPAGFLPQASGVGAVVKLVRVAADFWEIFGDLAEDI